MILLYVLYCLSYCLLFQFSSMFFKLCWSVMNQQNICNRMAFELDGNDSKLENIELVAYHLLQ